MLVVLIVVIVGILYVYNKPHRNVVGEAPTYSSSLDKMHNEFSADEEKASQKYFNKVVELSGTLTDLNKGENGGYNFVLESDGRTASGEIVELEYKESDLIGEKVKVKGLFIGYENLLEEIQLSECTITKF